MVVQDEENTQRSSINKKNNSAMSVTFRASVIFVSKKELQTWRLYDTGE